LGSFIYQMPYFGYVLPSLAALLISRQGLMRFTSLLAIACSVIMLLFLSQGGGRRLIGVTGGAAILVWVAITLGRRFYTQLGQRYDLIERGELVDLLREFEASGSGGIWELDAQLNMTHISEELATNVGSSPERLIGRNVRTILDPTDQIARLSEGMRTLFHHLESGVPFRDLPIPATASGRSKSASIRAWIRASASGTWHVASAPATSPCTTTGHGPAIGAA